MVCIGVSNENFSQSVLKRNFPRTLEFSTGCTEFANPEKERILNEDNMYSIDYFMSSLYPYSITKVSIVNDIYNESETLSVHLKKKRNSKIRWRNMYNIVRLKIVECTLRTLFYYSEWKQGVLTVNRDSAHFLIRNTAFHHYEQSYMSNLKVEFNWSHFNSTFQMSRVVRVESINRRLILTNS